MANRPPSDHPLVLLSIDDDPAVHELIVAAVDTVDVPVEFHGVHTFAQLAEFLGGTAVDGSVAPPVSLILVDLRMPGIDGYEVLARLKAHETWRVYPVVVLTTSWDAEAARRAYEGGAASFVLKPFMFDDLVTFVEDLSAWWGHAILPQVVR